MAGTTVTGRIITGAGRRSFRPVVAALFLSVAVLPAALTAPALAQSYSFSRVTVEGNQYVDPSSIVGFANLPRGAEISAADLNAAYQRIVNSGLFASVEIEPSGSTLIIRVVENPMVNIINFEGNKRLKDEELAKLIKSASSRVYSAAQAEQDAAAIAEQYRIKGRIAATVEPRIIKRDGNRVDLVFEVQEGKVVEVERISFVGNRAFSDRRLRQVLQSKQAGLLRAVIQRDTFVAERLDLDKQLLRDFYLSRGFIDVDVVDASSDVTRERDAFFITFTIREGQSYTIGNTSTVSEVEGLDAAEFDAVKRIRPGQTWSPSLIDANVTRMENLALAKGLNFIRVEPRLTRDNRNGTVDVQFVVQRGDRVFVERIDIEGNATTLDQVVRRQFRTAEGDPFNPREIRKAAERIRALSYFSDVQVEAQPGSTPEQVVVNVDVEEQPTGSLSLGASYGVSSGVGVSIGYSETNFLGRGQSVGLNLNTAASSRSFSASFSEPAFLGREVALGLSAGLAQTNNDSAQYDTRILSFSPSLEFPVGEIARLSVRYGIQQTELYDVDTDLSPIIQREADQGPLLNSYVGYRWSYDTRIEGINPNGGVLLRFGQNLGGLGGDREYLETTVFALAERRVLQEEVTVRAIFEGAVLANFGDSSSRVTDRYFANGKMRGFESNGIGPRDLGTGDALGGNVYATARFEADFPLGLPEEYGVNGGVFLDVGSVWGLDDKAGSAGTVDDALRLRSAVGVSILWDTPIGPLRFNFSRAVQKESYDKEQTFDLTVSTKF
jgi:outer membrane protein insertion porin family